jgi:Cu(I)/Ag(I) efflux system membrane fusion protein
MKKTLLSILAVAIVSVIAVSCGSNETKDKTSEMKDTMNMKTDVAGVQYTCPMHPEVVTDKPGSCPKCGMDLVKKEKMEMKSDSTMKGDSSMKMKM